jgi:hypothetical protein
LDGGGSSSIANSRTSSSDRYVEQYAVILGANKLRKQVATAPAGAFSAAAESHFGQQIRTCRMC